MNFFVNIEQLANPGILNQPVYEPGKPIEDVARELGLGPAGIIKLASNENPFGASPKAIDAARRALDAAELYPDGGTVALRDKLATRYAVKPEQIVVGNGSNELIELLGHVFLCPGDEVVMADCSFAVYTLVSLLFGAKPVQVPMVEYRHDLKAMAAAVTEKTKLVFVCCPNNPTGTRNREAELLAFARSLPSHVVLVLDEAYIEYLDEPHDLRVLIAEGRNVILLRTFSKVYGLAGFRIGYSISGAEMASLLNRARQPFNVNAIAQKAAMMALEDIDFVERCVTENRKGLVQLESGFTDLGLNYVASHANFVLVRVGDGARVFTEFQKRGLIVRPMRSYRMPEWIRVTVGTKEQNARLLKELKIVLNV